MVSSGAEGAPWGAEVSSSMSSPPKENENDMIRVDKNKNPNVRLNAYIDQMSVSVVGSSNSLLETVGKSLPFCPPLSWDIWKTLRHAPTFSKVPRTQAVF